MVPLPQVKAANTKLSLSHQGSEIRQMIWAKLSLLMVCNTITLHQSNLILEQITPNRPSNQEKEGYFYVFTKQLSKQPVDPFPQTYEAAEVLFMYCKSLKTEVTRTSSTHKCVEHNYKKIFSTVSPFCKYGYRCCYRISPFAGKMV